MQNIIVIVSRARSPLDNRDETVAAAVGGSILYTRRPHNSVAVFVECGLHANICKKSTCPEGQERQQQQQKQQQSEQEPGRPDAVFRSGLRIETEEISIIYHLCLCECMKPHTFENPGLALKIDRDKTILHIIRMCARYEWFGGFEDVTVSHKVSGQAVYRLLGVVSAAGRDRQLFCMYVLGKFVVE